MANQPTYTERTIFDFRSRLRGGGVRPNLFECNLNFPNLSALNMSDTPTDIQQQLRFLIKSAQLPGSTVGTIPVPFRGRTLKIAGDRTIDPWTITVINETSFALRNLFEQWSNFINRLDDNSGIISPEYYQTNIEVYQLSRGQTDLTSAPAGPRPLNQAIEILRAYRLYGCYPSAVDPIPLSYDTTDTIEEFNVTFEVQWWEAIDGIQGPSIYNTEETGAGTITVS